MQECVCIRGNLKLVSFYKYFDVFTKFSTDIDENQNELKGVNFLRREKLQQDWRYGSKTSANTKVSFLNDLFRGF